MKKILAIIFLIIIIVWWIFYKIQNDKQLELEKQQQIEYEKKKEEERKAYIEQKIEENKKRKEEFLNSLKASELSTYKENYPDYMIVFYKNDKVYKRIFTNNYPEKKYLNGECIEYSDIRVKKRNAEKEFCPDENQYYKVENLDFNSL